MLPQAKSAGSAHLIKNAIFQVQEKWKNHKPDKIQFG